jgi:glyoxylase-like metal-dependent hydrolase (beta-lactamase superfamily II)
MRRLSTILPTFAACVACVGVSSAQPQSARTFDAYVIDVEGGEATLFVSPSGESMLVDTGWPGFDGRDADRIVAAARDAGVTQIDYLVITHFHADHVGGAAQLQARLPIRRFIDHGAVDENPQAAFEGYTDYLDLRRAGARTQARPVGSQSTGSTCE